MAGQRVFLFAAWQNSAKQGHHFAARVERHALALPRRCRRVDARPAAGHPPLCFVRRQDRASHRSGWSRGAAPFPNTH